jgi:soluble lytic murein transglycosylase-like protein
MKTFLLLVCVPAIALSQRPSDIGELVDSWAVTYGFEPELIQAIIEVESSGNVKAVSDAGAAGLMQLMPATAAAFGVRNRFDPAENIRGGVAYLAWLRNLFAGDRRLMLAAYNAGHEWVRRYGLALPSTSVVDYVDRVAFVFRRLRWERVLREGGSPL